MVERCMDGQMITDEHIDFHCLSQHQREYVSVTNGSFFRAQIKYLNMLVLKSSLDNCGMK